MLNDAETLPLNECFRLLNLSTPNNAYEWLHAPLKVGFILSSSKFGEYIVSSVYSMVSPYYSLSKDCEAKFANISNNAFTDNIYISSQLDLLYMSTIFFAVYRIINLTAFSIKIRIMNQDWHNGSKFLCSTLVSTLPYFIMYNLGALPDELLIADLLINVASLIVKSPFNHYLKELEMVSPFNRFRFSDFTLRNTIHYLKHLSSAVIFSYFFEESYSTPAAGPGIYVCDSPDGLGHSYTAYDVETSFYGHLFTAFGSVIGKLIIDLSILALYKTNFIKDLRDPINSTLIGKVINGFTTTEKLYHQPLEQKSSASFKKKSSTKSHKVKEDIVNIEYKDFVVNTISNSTTVQNSSIIEEPLEEQVFTHKEKVKKRPLHRSEKTSSIVSKSEEPKDIITITGTDSKIVRLFNTNMNNLWGIIDPNVKQIKKDNNMDKFQTILDSGHVGHKGASIVYDKESQALKMRPKNSDARLLGKIIKGQDAEDTIYKIIRDISTVEQAILWVNKIKSCGSDVSCAVFNTYKDKH